MKTTINQSNLKKGDVIYLTGNWNGNEKETIDFMIEKYVVTACGKKQCYMISESDGTKAKRAFYCDQFINLIKDIDFDQVIEAAKEISFNYIKENIENLEANVTHYLIKYPNEFKYIERTKKNIDNLKTAPMRFLINGRYKDMPDQIIAFR